MTWCTVHEVEDGLRESKGNILEGVSHPEAWLQLDEDGGLVLEVKKSEWVSGVLDAESDLID